MWLGVTAGDALDRNPYLVMVEAYLDRDKEDG